MAEAIITRAGISGSGSGNGMIGAFITENTTFTFNKTGNWVVTVIGGGGGGGGTATNFRGTDRGREDSSDDWTYGSFGYASGGGAGSGYINSITQIFNKGDQYEITIGDGGTGGLGSNQNGFTGGSSFFGNLLSAEGGTGGGHHRTRSDYKDGYIPWPWGGAGGNGYINGTNGDNGWSFSGENEYHDGNIRANLNIDFLGGNGGKLYVLDMQTNNETGYQCGSGGNGAPTHMRPNSSNTVNVQGENGIKGGVIIRYLDEA